MRAALPRELKHPLDPAQLAKLMINIASGEVADPLRGRARIPRFDRGLVVQNHVQQGIMDFQFSVVFDKSQFAEFVHEKAHARSRRADHLRQGFLTKISHDRLRPAFLAEIRKKKESVASQAR